MIFTKYTNVPDRELISGSLNTVLEQELASRLEHYLTMKDELELLNDQLEALRKQLRWALKFVSKPDDVDAEEWAQRLEDAQCSSM